jgi:AAHS family 4-hydroxybenzoate transporter-like MFS transporter
MLVLFVAGLGIGGALPNGAALVYEFTPSRHRTLAMGIAMTFIPIGGAANGLLGGVLLPHVGWRGFFLVNGVAPTLMALALALLLPESPQFRAHTERSTNQSTEGQRSGSPISALFDGGLTTDTLALWAGFFFCLLLNYMLLSWVPTMLMGQGFALAASSLGVTALSLGGMTGSVAAGSVIDRFGSRAPALMMAAGAVAGAVVLGVVPFGPQRTMFTMVTLFVLGGCSGGLHNCLYAIGANLYQPHVRATGVGIAVGVGRVGAVLSAFAGALSLKAVGASGYFIVIAVAASLLFIALVVLRRHIGSTDLAGLTADRGIIDGNQ